MEQNSLLFSKKEGRQRGMKTESCLRLQERNAECSGEAGKREDQCTPVCAGALGKRHDLMSGFCVQLCICCCIWAFKSVSNIHVYVWSTWCREVKDQQGLDELEWKEMCRSPLPSLSAASQQRPRVTWENKSVRELALNGRESWTQKGKFFRSDPEPCSYFSYWDVICKCLKLKFVFF